MKLINLINKAWFTAYSVRKTNAEKEGITMGDRPTEKSGIIEGNTVFITGPLSEEGPDSWDIAMGYGGCSYQEVQKAIMEVNENLPDGEDLILYVDTPGGDISGVEATAALVREVAKGRRVISEVHGLCSSAGTWIVSGSTEINMIGRISRMGGVGVAMSVVDDARAQENVGIVWYELTNEESKDKRPDRSTESGRQVLIDCLNDLYAVFLDNVVEGRKGKVSKSSIESLKGTTVTAEKVVKIGLADNVVLHTFDINTPDEGLTGVSKMELEEFLAQDPNAKAKYDKELLEAHAKGVREEKESLKARKEAMSAFLDSDEYSQDVKKVCIKAITGERTVESVQDFISIIEAEREQGKSESIKDDLPANSDTPAQDASKVAAEKTQREVDARADAIVNII